MYTYFILILIRVLEYRNNFLFQFFLTYTQSGSWIPADPPGTSEWIQAEFDRYFKITGIQTQGRTQGKDRNTQWVTEYEISYSTNGEDWSVYLNDDGTEKVG